MKKLVAIVGAGVLVYSLIVYPTQLADGARTAFGWATNAVEAVLSFMRNAFA